MWNDTLVDGERKADVGKCGWNARKKKLDKKYEEISKQPIIKRWLRWMDQKC